MTSVPRAGLPGTNFERTFIAIKPDGVQRGKVGNIIARFESKGYKLVAMKMCTPSREKAAGHYADLSKKPFFGGLVDYFSSGPIVAMCWEGVNAIAQGRMLLGATNPKDSLPGTIRGDLCVDIGRNICHGSDGPDSAAHEICFWFDETEVSSYTSHSHTWVYEKGAAIMGGKGGKKAAKKEKKEKKPAAAPQLTKKQAEAAKAAEKKVKACFKEGGKKGQDIAGMSSFGCHFFLTAMVEPNGSMEHLKLCMDGANQVVDPEGEDRKGGSGDLAKIFFAASDDVLSVLGHVPVECEDKVSLEEFMGACLAPAKGVMAPAGDKMGSCTIKGDGKTVFPLKLRDECISAGFDFLRAKGLILDDDDSGDDINFADDCGVDLNAGAEGDY